MDTSTAAAQAGRTVATIRTWCRIGAVAAVKVAGRWVIDAAALAYRISLTTADRTREFVDALTELAYDLADRSIATAKAILATVKARDTAALTRIDPACVRLTDVQWTQAERMVGFQVSCLLAER